jgi:hypothetical protein
MYDNRNLRNTNVSFINRVTRCPVHTHVTVLIAGLNNSTKYLQGLLLHSYPVVTLCMSNFIDQKHVLPKQYSNAFRTVA